MCNGGPCIKRLAIFSCSLPLSIFLFSPTHNVFCIFGCSCARKNRELADVFDRHSKIGPVLKPETTKRNDRNETTETSATKETKPPKRPKRPKRNHRNERNERNETTETTETAETKPPKRPKRPKRNHRNDRNK